MDSESPPAKRQRTDSEDDAVERSMTIKRVPIFWFEDGNIILQVESRQYRVHKSILSMHSNFFKDLFQVPQPEEEPLTEGCQIVHLFDSPQDVEHILSLLYQCFIVHDLQKNLAFPVMAAMIRLGRKYDFTRLQITALRRLQNLFPKTLPDWLRLGIPRNTQFSAEILFYVINLAEQNAINTILPAAYLQVCMTCSLETIIKGVECKDGTQMRLNHQSMASCILGREKLASQLPKSIFPWLSKEPSMDPKSLLLNKECSRVSSCIFSSAKMMRVVFSAGLDGSRLKFLERPEEVDKLSAELCGDCKKAVSNEYINGRKSIWEELPSFFGLSKWGDLQDF